MPREGTGRDFIEALARGLEVIAAFEPGRPVMSLADVANATGLARPTARRILLTLAELGYVRPAGGGFALTPRVLELGIAYVRSMGLWDIARPHMERLVARTNESSSIAQLDGSDIVYVARVSVPKIVTLAVEIGTRFRPSRRRWARCCWPRCPATRSTGCWRNRPAPACSPAGSPMSPSATPNCGRFVPAAGRSPTSNSPRASARSPPRCATGRAASSPRSTSTPMRRKPALTGWSGSICRCC